MANHFKRARSGDVVMACKRLFGLGGDIMPNDRGVITGVETQGRVFRVNFDGRRRLTRKEDLRMIYRPKRK